MRRAAIILLLLLALAIPVGAQAPKPPSGPQPTPAPEPKPRMLAVSALVTGSGLRVTWLPVAGTRRACALRGAQLLHCVATPPLWLLPQDAGRLVSPGERIELRVYDAGMTVVARGEATARWVRYLPSIAKPSR